jgi:transcriptional regulator with XRE-family HTH domain
MRSEIVEWKIQKIFSERERHSFPALLGMLRRVQGITRKTMEEELGINETRLFYLEQGEHSREIPAAEIKLIADYYGVDAQALYEMSKEYRKDYQNFRKNNKKYLKKEKSSHDKKSKILV